MPENIFENGFFQCKNLGKGVTTCIFQEKNQNCLFLVKIAPN